MGPALVSKAENPQHVSIFHGIGIRNCETKWRRLPDHAKRIPVPNLHDEGSQILLTNTRLLFAVNTGQDVFEAIVPTCIVAYQKQRPESYAIPVADLRTRTLKELPRLLDVRFFGQTSSEIVLQTPNAMFSFDLNRAKLVTKLATSFQSFGDFCMDVANGICTSCDDVYIVSEGFAKQERLEAKYLKPCIRGSQFNRYFCPQVTNDYVLYVTDTLDPNAARNTLNYLAEHRRLLVEKCVEKKNGLRHWEVLFRRRYPELFAVPKILIRQTADRIIATIDDEIGYYCINSMNVAVLKPQHADRIQFFLGLLNSVVVNFFYREISQEKGRVLAEVKPQRVRALPIPPTDSSRERAITEVVKKIIRAKRNDPTAEAKELEHELNSLVCGLYNLTGNDIALIEESMGTQTGGRSRASAELLAVPKDA